MGKYVYKVNATGKVFYDLQSAVNNAAADIYRCGFGGRMSNPIAHKIHGGYAVSVFGLSGKVYTRNIDVFVPAILTKKGKQVPIDGLSKNSWQKYREFSGAKYSLPKQAETDTGYDSGFEAGYDKGYNEGYDACSFDFEGECDDHYNEGYDVGHDDGYNEGYDDGHEDGYQEALDLTEDEDEEDE